MRLVKCWWKVQKGERMRLKKRKWEFQKNAMMYLKLRASKKRNDEIKQWKRERKCAWENQKTEMIGKTKMRFKKCEIV